jgi:hypothetical protein
LQYRERGLATGAISKNHRIQLRTALAQSLAHICQLHRQRHPADAHGYRVAKTRNA